MQQIHVDLIAFVSIGNIINLHLRAWYQQFWYGIAYTLDSPLLINQPIAETHTLAQHKVNKKCNVLDANTYNN